MIHIQVKPGCEQALRQLRESGLGSFSLAGYFVNRSKGGKVEHNSVSADGLLEEKNENLEKVIRLELAANPFNPLTELTEIPQEIVERVTWLERIPIPYRSIETGIFSNGATKLFAKTIEWNGMSVIEVTLVAPSLDAATETYGMFRQGKLTPEVAWLI